MSVSSLSRVVGMLLICACSTVPRQGISTDEPHPDVAPLAPEQCAHGYDYPAKDLRLLEFTETSVTDWRPRHGLMLRPALTREFRAAAHCRSLPSRNAQTAFAVYQLARASIHEAGKVHYWEGDAAAAAHLLETWAASLHQAGAGDIVSAMAGLAVEDLVLEQLEHLDVPAAQLPKIERLASLRAQPSALTDLKAYWQLPGWKGKGIAAWCNTVSKGAAQRVDEAYAAGDHAWLKENAETLRRAWWRPERMCMAGVSKIMGEALEHIEELDATHRRLADKI